MLIWVREVSVPLNSTKEKFRMKSTVSWLAAGILTLALCLGGYARSSPGDQKPTQQPQAKKSEESCDKMKESCCNKKDAKGKTECPLAAKEKSAK